MSAKKQAQQLAEKALEDAKNKAKSKITNKVKQYGYGHPLVQGNTEKMLKYESVVKEAGSLLDTDKDLVGDGTGGHPDDLQNNWLHKFATFNSIFTLSGISEEELTTHSFLTNPVHDIIARSGGIGDPKISDGKYKKELDELQATIKESNRGAFLHGKTYNEKYTPIESVRVLKQSHDLFFENFNMLSTVGPNAERGLANFTKCNFEIVEPYGVTFVEKVKAATFINGYKDFQDAPLLLTIEFKGTDENGKRLYDQRRGGMGFVRKIPILIVKVEFDINEAGATYQVVAVPHGDLAHDDRFKFPRSVLNLSVNSIDDPDPNKGWIAAVTKQLDDTMQQEIDENRRVDKDEFQFLISSEVKDRCKYNDIFSTTLAESNKTWIQRWFSGADDPEIKLAEAQVDGQTSLVKFYEDAIRIGGGYSAITDRLWQYWHLMMTQGSSGLTSTKNTAPGEKGGMNIETDYDELMKFYGSSDFKNKAKNHQWLDWFEIKVSVEHIKPDYIDPIRKVSPKRIIFKAVPKKIHVLKFFPPGVALGFMDWSKWVRKTYNYIYTGQNVDVQNLRINYKTAYYLRNIRPFDKDTKERGKYKDFENNLIEIFGADSGEPVAPIRQEASIQKGTNTMSAENNQTQQFYDYITNPEADMIRLEMEILGDPAFICQDQYIPIHKNRSKSKPDGIGYTPVSNKFRSFNSENFQPLIQLNFVTPPDINDKKGHYNLLTNSSADRGSRSHFFTGIYQVVKVDTKFNQGQFLQTLHCVRLNQQQGSGIGAIVTNIKKDYKNTNAKKINTSYKAQAENIGETFDVHGNKKTKEQIIEEIDTVVKGRTLYY